MNLEKRSLVGRDSDDLGGGCLGVVIGIFLVVIVVAIILFVICCLGAIIGGFSSLKNYILSFKHNVYDSNRSTAVADT